jgi:hypothetical protein
LPGQPSVSVNIPERVRRLVHEHLPSMEHVELLLLLVNASDQSFLPSDAARELQVESDVTARRLADLAGARLAAREGPAGMERFRYAPGDLDVRQAVEQLVEAYRTRPVSLIRVVYERPPESAQHFADAFRLRKE